MNDTRYYTLYQKDLENLYYTVSRIGNKYVYLKCSTGYDREIKCLRQEDYLIHVDVKYSQNETCYYTREQYDRKKAKEEIITIYNQMKRSIETSYGSFHDTSDNNLLKMRDEMYGLIVMINNVIN
jgi:hypothetical protein